MGTCLIPPKNRSKSSGAWCLVSYSHPTCVQSALCLCTLLKAWLSVETLIFLSVYSLNWRRKGIHSCNPAWSHLEGISALIAVRQEMFHRKLPPRFGKSNSFLTSRVWLCTTLMLASCPSCPLCPSLSEVLTHSSSQWFGCASSIFDLGVNPGRWILMPFLGRSYTLEELQAQLGLPMALTNLCLWVGMVIFGRL